MVSGHLDYRPAKRRKTISSPLVGFPTPRERSRRPLITRSLANARGPRAISVLTISETPPLKRVTTDGRSSQATRNGRQDTSDHTSGDVLSENAVGDISEESKGPSQDGEALANHVTRSSAQSSRAPGSHQTETPSNGREHERSSLSATAGKEGALLSSQEAVRSTTPCALRTVRTTKATSVEVVADDINQSGLTQAQHTASVPPPEESTKREEAASGHYGGKDVSKAAQTTRFRDILSRKPSASRREGSEQVNEKNKSGTQGREDGNKAAVSEDACTRARTTKKMLPVPGRRGFRTENAWVQGGMHQVVVINEDSDDHASSKGLASSLSRNPRTRSRRIVPWLRAKNKAKGDSPKAAVNGSVGRVPSSGCLSSASQKPPTSSVVDAFQERSTSSPGSVDTSERPEENPSFEDICKRIPGLSEYKRRFAEQEAWWKSKFEELGREKDELQALRLDFDVREKRLQQQEQELHGLLSRTREQPFQAPRTVEQRSESDGRPSSRARVQGRSYDDGSVSLGSSMGELSLEETRQRQQEEPPKEVRQVGRLAVLDAALSAQQPQEQRRLLRRKRDPNEDLEFAPLDLSAARKASEIGGLPRQEDGSLPVPPRRSRKATCGQRKSYPNPIRPRVSAANEGDAPHPDAASGQQAESQKDAVGEHVNSAEPTGTRSQTAFERLLGIAEDPRALLRDRRSITDERPHADASAAT